MALNAILDPFLSPLLKLNALIAVIIICFVLSFLMTLAYKKFTDQNLMKQLKDEIKEFQSEMKTLRDNPSKMMEVQKKAMETNTKYMMQSFKPMLVTFIPLIIIFGWLHAHMAYYPIVENQEFSALLEFDESTSGNVTLVAPEKIEILNGGNVETIHEDKVKFVMKGPPGEYVLKYLFKEKDFESEIIIVKNKEDREYKNPIVKVREETELKTITISNKKIQPFKGIPLLESIPWIGNFGWLGAYIILQMRKKCQNQEKDQDH